MIQSGPPARQHHNTLFGGVINCASTALTGDLNMHMCLVLSPLYYWVVSMQSPSQPITRSHSYFLFLGRPGRFGHVGAQGIFLSQDMMKTGLRLLSRSSHVIGLVTESIKLTLLPSTDQISLLLRRDRTPRLCPLLAIAALAKTVLDRSKTCLDVRNCPFQRQQPTTRQIFHSF